MGDGTGGRRADWRLVSEDMRNGKVTSLTTTVGRPVFTLDGDQVVVRPDPDDGFVRLDLDTGRALSRLDVILPPHTAVSAFAADSGWTAWVASAGAKPGAAGILVLCDPQGRVYQLGSHLSLPWFTKGYLLYEAPHGALWAFDLEKRIPVRLGEHDTGAGLLLRVQGAGSTLVEQASHSRRGIVTLYRLTPPAGASGTSASSTPSGR
jgi:hypothetical protein